MELASLPRCQQKCSSTIEDRCRRGLFQTSMIGQHLGRHTGLLATEDVDSNEPSERTVFVQTVRPDGLLVVEDVHSNEPSE